MGGCCQRGREKEKAPFAALTRREQWHGEGSSEGAATYTSV